MIHQKQPSRVDVDKEIDLIVHIDNVISLILSKIVMRVQYHNK